MKVKSYQISVIDKLTATVAAGLLVAMATACSSSSDDNNPPADAGVKSDAKAGSDTGVEPDTSVAADAGVDSSTVIYQDAGNSTGNFTVSLDSPRTNDAGQTTPGSTTIIGFVYNKPVPQNLYFEQTLAQGDCRLYTKQVAYCSPDCNVDTQTCIQGATCEDNAVSQSVGTVTVKGISSPSGEKEWTIKEPSSTVSSKDYQAVPTPPYLAFSEGDEITISASGSSFSPAFTLKAKGIAPLEVLFDSIALEGKDAALTWTPPGQAGISKIHVKLDLSFHAPGGSKGHIECDTGDDGSLTLSGTMLKKLLSYGAAGFPTIVLTRIGSGSSAVPAGEIDLLITSEVTKAVTVPGLTSCNKDANCPSGQTCQTKGLYCK